MKNFDVVLIGDFRFPGGTSIATAHEIRALADAGLTIGLLQSNAEILRLPRPMHAAIRACVNNNQATIISGDERKVEAKLGILHNPLVFTKFPERLPKLRLDQAILVAHQAHTDRKGVPYYDARQVHAVCEQVTNGKVMVAPISPVVRANYRRTAARVPLLDEDWHNIVYIEEWARDRSGTLAEDTVLGRHGRADKDKWPATRREILTVYPDAPGVRVRLLGTGDYLKRVMGEYPDNWTTYRFGQVEPQKFLKTIDFFLYYHHPDLVEAFGRTVIEACASGAVAILPPHFEPTFGEAAIYRAPGEAVETARELHRNSKNYHRQSKRASRIVAEHFGPARHAAFVRRLIGQPKLRPIAKSKKDLPMNADARFQLVLPEFDVVIIADMRAPNDAALRISHEIRIQHAHGFRTALLHLPSGRVKAATVRGEIQACVRDGMAQVLTPLDQVRATLMVVHGPEDVLEPIPDKLPRIFAERLVVVASRPPDRSYSLMRKHRLLALAFQIQPTWAPASPQIRESLMKAWAEIPLDPEDWTISLMPRQWRSRTLEWDRPVIGRVDTEPPLDFGKAENEGKAPPQPTFPNCYVRTLQAAPIAEELPAGLVDQLVIEEQAVGKFLDSLDFLYVNTDEQKPPPSYAIAEAMQRGVVVLTKPELAREFGSGAIGCGPAKADETVRTLYRNKAELSQLSRDGSRGASVRFSPSNHVERISRLAGGLPSAQPTIKLKRQRIAFITSNGVGLGHLTRLLCIARRLPPTVDPIFVTMSQAFGIVKDFGFPVEYIPFTSHSEMSGVQDWNDWFKLHIEPIFDAYGITGAVFDGGAPYGGLVRAIATRPDFFTVWVRRGMWKPGKSNENLLKRQKYFDLVIEPRDVADVKDHGPTSTQTGRSAYVDPIRLLDSEELLDRRSAARAIGIDPKRPAVLIQLGSGTTSEIVSQTNDIIKACARFPRLQVVIAEWAIGAVSFDVWPEVKVLRGFPLSRFFNAFDFTISAVGYNSFNEIISFGLPAIFLANENPIMDDQAGRAAFAVDQGAALLTTPGEIKDLHILIEALLDERARSVIKVNCARIALPNGAQAAADLILRLAGAVEREASEFPAKPIRRRLDSAPVEKPRKAKKVMERA